MHVHFVRQLLLSPVNVSYRTKPVGAAAGGANILDGVVHLASWMHAKVARATAIGLEFSDNKG